MLIVNNNNTIIETPIKEYKNSIRKRIENTNNRIKIRKNLKIIIAGEGAVGKTTLIQRYLGRPFRAQYLITLGVQTSGVTMNLESIIGLNESIDLQLWDLAGQQQYRDVVKQFFVGTDEAIVVGDLSRISTVEKVIDWIDEINKQNMKTTRFIIVGSKLDLVTGFEGSLKAKIKEILLNAKDQFNINEEIIFIKTSSLDNINITEVFELAILRNILGLNR